MHCSRLSSGHQQQTAAWKERASGQAVDTSLANY